MKVEPPPRATENAPVTQILSFIALPIELEQKAISSLLEREIPSTLWTINQHERRCVAPQKVNILGAKLNVTPPISCTIIGHVRRGRITLTGAGKDIIANIPIHATISARDVGGVLKGETATGSAIVKAHIKLDIRPDWTPTGTVRLSYGWTEAPGIDFLGQRITFTEQADEKLHKVKHDLERSLPRELAKINLRPQVAELWKQAFSSLLLNERNPPVWMRISPEKLVYDGYSLSRGKVRLRLGMSAKTETFIGARPDNPVPTPLPNLVKERTDGQLHFFIPVIADYKELEPVILKALVKRSARPFELPLLGPVNARFESVTAYATDNGRIAVGITLAAKPVSSAGAETKGMLWMTALPVNKVGSPKVAFEDMQVVGNTDGVGGDLLIQLASNPAVTTLIASSLTQNFSNDLDGLMVKIRKAIGNVREGDFVLNGHIGDYEIGRIQAFGNGLYLPVRVKGTATAKYKPSK